MSMTTELALPLDFTKPLETESGEPVKYICHDVIEYKQARVCVDIDTGVVYSSPYAGMKIRNVIKSEYESLRESIEDAASAYYEFDNGWISHMDCCDRSHEYLMFVKEPKNVLAQVEALEAAKKRIAELESRTVKLPSAWWVKQGAQSLLAYEKQMLLDALIAAGVAVEGE